MKPLSEKELREKIRELVFDYTKPSGLNLGDTTDAILALILSDRKAWGEHVIGEDEEYIPGNPLLGRLSPRRKELVDADNELRALQRKRNQGEKTDEDS